MRKEEGELLGAEELLDEYADMVYRIAFVQMKQSSDADDIFQEVFLRLVEHIHTLKSKEHAKHWLIRVTINCCKKYFDTSWSKKRVGMDEYLLEQKTISQDENVENLLEACLSLGEDQRTVIHLFYFEGYSVREISQLLELSESAVKTRLSRARDALRLKMKGDFFE
ncbi:sigma-70 family RNA polymerase sigma factor [Enterococcus sp. BWB1-3]|uniref:RNA polymerase sigma factor n=1 Tax=unclassified Enterococcus TaxID=2608891 RepID=UPI0019212D61|nr:MULTISPECIES: sigma-70 family RNA polymerase sigma factor [unclassified Enterococcus]MBL1229257.1 sigma-70 family RNA polymerase sigma factor [Enterococcus sp. BWB1-3]MCB5951747.1 sigma-70 family RNA polymerase sigma factor [Enterococcus sp. BWT-B8]MCB5955770.1 sigma-70 family RNA polymerase sigma factor [Enterococcus sp. CWB-B31]